MQVERDPLDSSEGESGERVSNALVTCPEVGDNSSKGLLIPHVVAKTRSFVTKGAIRFGRDLRPIS